jgi:hypothetical protein
LHGRGDVLVAGIKLSCITSHQPTSATYFMNFSRAMELAKGCLLG